MVTEGIVGRETDDTVPAERHADHYIERVRRICCNAPVAHEIDDGHCRKRSEYRIGM
jgi:hypothetical protein